MAKEVYFDKEARQQLLKGMKTVAMATGSTLGAGGNSVIISPGYGHPPKVTKDGVTVVKSIRLAGDIENAGAMMMIESANKQLEDAGDGTTATTVLAYSLIENGMKAIDEGASPRKVVEDMNKAKDAVVEELKKMSIPVTSTEMLKQVATISANNDPEIGGKLAEAYEKIGHNGKITIEKSYTIDTYVETIDGSEFNAGYVSERFITDVVKRECVLDNPLVYVFDHEIKTIQSILPLLESFAQVHDFRNQSMVIVAKGFDGEPHNTMIVNKEKNGAKVCLIQAPSAYQKEALRDLAVLTGATLITNLQGKNPEHCTVEHGGRCKKIIISKASAILHEPGGDKTLIEELKNEVKSLRDDEANPDLKEIWDKRLNRLDGSLGVIYVGGKTDIEIKERIDRVDDANRAIKSAVAEGVVAGGGMALMRASQVGNIGWWCNKSFSAPFDTIVENAGETARAKTTLGLNAFNNPNFGFDVLRGTGCDMVKSGIIDPTKVVRCALENAVSLASQVLSSKVLLIEVTPK